MALNNNYNMIQPTLVKVENVGKTAFKTFIHLPLKQKWMKKTEKMILPYVRNITRSIKHTVGIARKFSV